jgi:hypothetical protein
VVFNAVLRPELRTKIPALDLRHHEGPSVAVLRVHFPENTLFLFSPLFVSDFGVKMVEIPEIEEKDTFRGIAYRYDWGESNHLPSFWQ